MAIGLVKYNNTYLNPEQIVKFTPIKNTVNSTEIIGSNGLTYTFNVPVNTFTEAVLSAEQGKIIDITT